MSDSRASNRAAPIHLVGIGGSGMSALANFFLDQGLAVTGSDICANATVRQLAARGVAVNIGHAAGNLSCEPHAVVRSMAVDLSVPELALARARGLTIATYPQALGALAATHDTVGVAGTHGKTTTTGMIAHVLQELGEEPSWIMGGVPASGMRPWHVGGGRTLVLESCEYARSFMDIPAQLAVVTAIDNDHLDCYGDLDGVRAMFRRYSDGILERGGRLLVAADLGLTEHFAETGVDRDSVLTYGLMAEAYWSARAIESTPDGTSFVLLEGGTPRGQVRCQLLGAHNVHNALAAIAVATMRGHDPRAAAAALSSFRGVGRRLECLGKRRGALLYDDYAHHPTAVSAVLTALRQAHPTRRLVALFEPHQITRTLQHLSSFSTALGSADACAITEIHAARDHTPAAISGEDLVRRLQARGRPAAFAPTLSEVVDYLDAEVHDGDVVVMMGAGRVGEGFAARVGPQLDIEDLGVTRLELSKETLP